MTTEEADKHLQDLGFFNPGHDFQKLWAFGKALVGDREMHRLKDLVTGNYNDGEEQILKKMRGRQLLQDHSLSEI